MPQIPYQKIISLCKQIYHVVPQATTPSAVPVSTDLWGVSQKALDVAAGLLAVYVIKIKWSQGKRDDTQLMKLIHNIQERDEVIERLQTEVKGWKMQHGKITNNHHLHK